MIHKRLVNKIKTKHNNILDDKQTNSWLKENRVFEKRIKSYTGLVIDSKDGAVYLQEIELRGNSLNVNGTRTSTTKVELVGDKMRSTQYYINYFENLDVTYSTYSVSNIDLKNKVDFEQFQYDANGKQTGAYVIKNGQTIYKEGIGVKESYNKTVPPKR